VGVHIPSSWVPKAIHMFHSKVSMILFKYLGLPIGGKKSFVSEENLVCDCSAMLNIFFLQDYVNDRWS